LTRSRVGEGRQVRRARTAHWTRRKPRPERRIRSSVGRVVGEGGWVRTHPGLFALRAEDVEDLDGAISTRAEPVWFGRVELGHLAGTERELALSEYEQQLSCEDEEPLVAGVGDEPARSRRDHLLEDLETAWVLRHGHQDASLSLLQ